MAMNQMSVHLGCKSQLLELSHSGMALQSPQHRKKRAPQDPPQEEISVMQGVC